LASHRNRDGRSHRHRYRLDGGWVSARDHEFGRGDCHSDDPVVELSGRDTVQFHLADGRPAQQAAPTSPDLRRTLPRRRRSGGNSLCGNAAGRRPVAGDRRQQTVADVPAATCRILHVAH